MATKSIQLQVPDCSSSPVSIYQFREVPLGPHLHNKLKEHNMSMECTETIVVPVQQEACSIGKLVTGTHSYISTPSSTCTLVVGMYCIHNNY